MDLNRLRTFKILAETLSFTETAKIVHVTQSAISQQMKLLQEDYGHKLVQKINNNLILTPEGQGLYFDIKDELERLEKRLIKNKDKERPLLRLAGPQNFINEILIPKLPRRPFHYQIDFLNSTQCNEDLMCGKKDIVFVSSPLGLRLCESSVVFTEKLILMGGPKLLQHYNEKGTLPFVDMNQNFRLLKKWEELNKMTLKVHLISEIPNIQSILIFIRHHPVAAIIPEHLAREDLKSGRLISLFPKQVEYTNQVHMCILKQQKSKLVWKFFEQLR